MGMERQRLQQKSRDWSPPRGAWGCPGPPRGAHAAAQGVLTRLVSTQPRTACDAPCSSSSCSCLLPLPGHFPCLDPAPVRSHERNVKMFAKMDTNTDGKATPPPSMRATCNYPDGDNPTLR